MKEAVGTRSLDQETVESSDWTVEVAQLWPPRGQWTEADYFSLPDTNRFIELSEGALVMPPHPTDTHQRIVLCLVRVFDDFVTLTTQRPHVPMADKERGRGGGRRAWSVGRERERGRQVEHLARCTSNLARRTLIRCPNVTDTTGGVR